MFGRSHQNYSTNFASQAAETPDSVSTHCTPRQKFWSKKDHENQDVILVENMTAYHMVEALVLLVSNRVHPDIEFFVRNYQDIKERQKM